MVSEWRVVRSKNTGLVSTYFFDDSLTIENLKGEQRGLLFDELKDCKEKICGVVIESRVYNFNGDTPVVYYSLAKEIDEELYIVTGTPDMCHSYIEYYGSDIVKPIFIVVSDRERLLRAIKREDTNKGNYKEVARRFYDEFNEYTKENILSLSGVEYVNNDYLEDCIEDIRCIIEGIKKK